MQFHKVMEPVFALLGIPLTSRNIAHGGLGTMQNALGARDIYGDEIDIMVWDSSMTEGRDPNAVDLFVRQALISGNRVPFLLGGVPGILKIADESFDADVGQFGEALDGVPTCMDEKDAEKHAYAARFILCDKERGDMCRDNKYLANCWVDRSDVTPPTPQADKPGSQVSWHPGFRWHQIVGRGIAFTVLKGLKDALTMWKESGMKTSFFAVLVVCFGTAFPYAVLSQKTTGCRRRSGTYLTTMKTFGRKYERWTKALVTASI